MSDSFKKRPWLAFILLLELVLPWLTACGSSAPALGQPGRPSLIFIYTDG